MHKKELLSPFSSLFDNTPPLSMVVTISHFIACFIAQLKTLHGDTIFITLSLL